MAGVVLVPPKFQLLDAIGNPLAGGSVDVYIAGSTTRTNTWQDQAQTILNTNPIVLDANGSCTMVVDSTLVYKLVVKDSTGVVQPHLGGDNIIGASSSSSSNLTFLAAGTGSVSRSVQDKERDFISVKDKGAVGDGSTVDTTAINNAIASLSAGKTLYFPASSGAYVIDAVLTSLPVGAGVYFEAGAWIKRATGAGNVVFFTVTGDNTIEGANIDGNEYPLSGLITGTWLASSFGIFGDGAAPATNVRIIGCQIKNIYTPIRADGAQQWRIIGNKIHRTQQSGILFGADVASPVKNNIVANNYFEKTGDTACAFFQKVATAEISYNKVIGNTAFDTNQRVGGYAFDVEAGTVLGYQHHNAFIGNTVQIVTASGLQQGAFTIGNFCSDSIIADNIAHGNGNSTADCGINVPLTTNVQVTGNLVEGFRGFGINTDGATGCNVYGNKIKNCGGPSSSFPGISIAAGQSTQSVSVRGNHLSWDDGYAYAGAGSVAIACFTASGKTVKNIEIAGNTISNAIDIGIQTLGFDATNRLTGLAIKDNTMTGGGTLFTRQPISVSFCTQAVISGNFVKDAKTGFQLRNTTKMRFIGNSLKNDIADVLGSWIDITGTTDSHFDNNEFSTSVTTPISPLSQLTTGSNNNFARNNRGFVTENKGVTGAIATGTTVSHGLSATPTNVILTKGDAGVTGDFPSAFTATTFTINYTGGGTHTFYWKAEL